MTVNPPPTQKNAQYFFMLLDNIDFLKNAPSKFADRQCIEYKYSI